MIQTLLRPIWSFLGLFAIMGMCFGLIGRKTRWELIPMAASIVVLNCAGFVAMVWIIATKVPNEVRDGAFGAAGAALGASIVFSGAFAVLVLAQGVGEIVQAKMVSRFGATMRRLLTALGGKPKSPPHTP